ncbi:MAG TPA: PASTA domain-containing protein [Sunxiuqinia sp.]|nr:PASTA domain-containing protein [Sunxiuqinia sp.]
MSFKGYLVSKAFWLNVLIAVGVAAVLLLGTTFALRIYTHHGESFAVPDFAGMPIDTVEQKIKEEQLRYKITDSLYVKEAEPGSIIDQVPEAGFHVKEGRTIFLTICARKPEQIAMPKLTDVSYRQALNLMMSYGLKVGNVDYVPSEFPNLVLDQKLNGQPIKEGDLVNKGSNIDLTVGQSRFGEKTEIPNLIGVRFDQANQLLAASYLNVGAVIYDDSFETREDSLNAMIWQQKPEPTPGAKIEQGTSIDVWLTVNEKKLNDVSPKD